MSKPQFVYLQSGRGGGTDFRGWPRLDADETGVWRVAGSQGSSSVAREYSHII